MKNEYFYPCQALESGLKKQPSSISVLIAGPLDKRLFIRHLKPEC